MADAGNAGSENLSVSEQIAESLMPGHMDVLRRLFDEHGARSPTIIWSPAPHDLAHPRLRRFAEICEGWMNGAGRVPAARFDTDALGTLADWLMLVDPDNGDFRYASYGAGISDHAGRDMTGARVSEIGGHISQFFEGVYRAVLERREWVLSEHEPPPGVFVRAWRRLIVPLFAGDDETVVRLAVLNVPENELRAGLELVPDPVFVADAEQRVQYANTAARKAFSIASLRAPGQRLRDLVGFDLDEEPAPDDLLAEGLVLETDKLVETGGIAERLRMSVSAAEHRGMSYFVIVLRPVST